MIDTKTLARELGITEPAVRSRASKLGISPQEISAGRGRPRQMWDEDQAQAIRSYGTTPDQPDPEFDQGEAGAIVSAQSVALVATHKMLQALDQQCDSIEEKAAAAVAMRIAAIPARSFQKASLLLQESALGFDLAGFGDVGISPYARQIAGDRFPESIQ